eukprot:CAMPEP_0184411138 /NCGR_PEP_ID=MMETSP0738-20130409/5420_1 /TAXON_ID=385413 /ORGANISM="Thalassiosira miniscula, Strain CCMP1093" /LENGTH=88 /DNA_ID=CAMNT_0026769293 /DNA_START=23 /DNA_END=285 /DNA_ORIENTATION=-
MIVMAYVDKRITSKALLRNWAIVLLGNAIGCSAIVSLVYGAGLLDGPLGHRAAAIASSKITISPFEAFCRGILCNALVCLAVWLAVSA